MSIEIPVSRTKIVVPTLRREVVHRARLLALLDEVLDRQLILVQAPAGYGKTTLLADYASRCPMPACWLSLDALDKDPQRFVACLIASIAVQFADFGKNTRSILHGLTDIEQETERLVTVLVNEIAEQIDRHFVIIVDDYQFVDQVPAIRVLFSRFLAQAGENCHVVLASRRLPDLPDIAQMVARQQVGGFDLEELAFRAGEIRDLFEQGYNLTLEDAALDELIQATEGWVTGLHLTAAGVTRTGADLGAWSAKTNARRAARTSGVDLDAYLEQQLLAPQTAQIRDFLLKTSLLEEFDADLCKSVFGVGEWKKLLEAVRKNNLFVLPVGPNGRWLRYHHIFQDFLQRRLLEEQPDEVAIILKKLAEVYQEQFEWEKAYVTVQKCNDPQALVRLVERAGTFILLGGRLIILQSWLDAIPVTLLEESPSLLSLKGALLCAVGQAKSAAPLLDRAVFQFRSAGDLPGLAQALARRAAVRRLLGEHAGAVHDADEVIQLATSPPGLETEHAEALRFRGLGLSRLGRLDEAVAALEESLRRYALLGEAESIARLQMELGQAYRAIGKWPAAAHFYQKALEEWRREGNRYSQATVLNSLGVLYHAQGNYELAVKALEEGLASARQNGFDWQKALLLTSLGDLLSDLDEFEPAHRAYDTAMGIALHIDYQFLIRYLTLAQARLARSMGNVQEAHALLQIIRNASGLNATEQGLLFLECGILSLLEYGPEAALPDLLQALILFEDGNQATETAWTHAWLAAACTGSGDETAGCAHLRAAISSLPAGAGVTSILHVLRRVAPWLSVLRLDPETDALLSRVAQSEKNLPTLRKRLRRVLTAIPLQPARLEVQAFGKPQVRVNRKLVTLAQWQSLAVRDLFCYFLSRSRPVTKEEIGEVFWPEIDPDQLKIRFKNNLYRLRRAVGPDVVLFENDSYFFNRLVDYEYDVEVFQTRLVQAETARSVEEKLAFLEEAAGLWRGPYLQDVDGLWASSERAELERAYLDVLRQVVELQRKVGEPKAALQTCQRALQANACLEEFHREAMRIHADLKDRLSVIWQYQACCNALRAELNVEPSKETRTLYERLIA